jgi:hypothetical protein
MRKLTLQSKRDSHKKEWVVDVYMCVSVCLLQVNGVEEFCGFALLELCCDALDELWPWWDQLDVLLTNFGGSVCKRKDK